MPALVEYVNRENITPTDRATESRVQQARRQGAAFNQVAESVRDTGHRLAQQAGGAIRDAGDAAVAYQDHREISQGAAVGAMLFNSLTNDKDNLVKGIDTNDPGYSTKVAAALDDWRTNTLEPKLDDFRKGFTTQKSQQWAEHFIDTTRQHMFLSTAADISTAAGIGVQNNAKQVLTTASNTVVSDPSAVRTQLDLWDHTIDGMVDSSSLKGTDALKSKTSMKEEGHRKIVQDAATSAILKSKDKEATAQEWINTWPQYINGDEALKLGKAAKAAAKTDALTDHQTQVYARQAADDAAKKQSAKVMQDNMEIDGATGRVTLKPNFFKDAFNITVRNPDAPNAADTARALINWGQHQQQQRRETIVTDTDTMSELYTGIFSATKPTTAVDILNAETTGKLDRYDAQNLLKLQKEVEDRPLTGAVWRDTIDAVKGMLGTDPIGHGKFGQFVSAFIPEYQKMARAGTLPPDALDLRNPDSMISKALAPYRRDAAQMFMDRVSHGMISPGDVNMPGFAAGVEKATGVNPQTVRQGGHTYKRQSDGSWKAID